MLIAVNSLWPKSDQDYECLEAYKLFQTTAVLASIMADKFWQKNERLTFNHSFRLLHGIIAALL